MSLIKSSISKLTYFILFLSTLLSPNLTAQVGAQSKVVAMFEPPPGRDAPRGGTFGGGSRPVGTQCLSNPSAKSNTLTALSPGQNLGLTQTERPNLLVYLPETTAKKAELSLFDEQMKGIYQVNIPVTKAGLVSISLPDTAPTLAKNKPYYWTFALVCNANDRTDDLVVGGWLELAQPSDSLKQQLATATFLEKVSLYAKQGYWYDALTTLNQLQQTQPNNPELTASWAQLLKSAGLDAIATKPLD
jgi:hypothetical protein